MWTTVFAPFKYGLYVSGFNTSALAHSTELAQLGRSGVPVTVSHRGSPERLVPKPEFDNLSRHHTSETLQPSLCPLLTCRSWILQRANS